MWMCLTSARALYHMVKEHQGYDSGPRQQNAKAAFANAARGYPPPIGFDPEKQGEYSRYPESPSHGAILQSPEREHNVRSEPNQCNQLVHWVEL